MIYPGNNPKINPISSPLLTVEGDNQEGRPMIRPYMKGGKRLAPPESLADIRSRAADELASLPEHLRNLKNTPPYPVEVSEKLIQLKKDIEKEINAVEK